jgi:hypothetical protein
VKSGVDIGAIAGYVASGGLAGMTAFAAVVDPKHALIYAAGMGAIISVAGIVRIIANPTATNTVQVFDRTTGSTVDLKTVAAPSAVPATAPTYAKGAP